MPRHWSAPLAVLILVSMAKTSQAQRSEPPTEVNVPGVVEAAWRTIIDPLGRTSRHPYFFLASNADLARAGEVLRTDAAYHRAVADRDVAGLDRLLGDRFAGVEHSGMTVDKRSMLERLPALEIQSVELSRATVRFTENIATVTGVETQVTAKAREQLLFARTYALTAGEWRLLSNVQFRDPR
jgi:hypothetical protein